MSDFEILTSQNVNIEIEPASLGDRIIATLIDFAVLFILYLIFILILISNKVYDNFGFNLITYVIFIISLPIVFYSFLFEVFQNGQTIGKKAMKIRVVMLDGSAPGVSAYLLRWLFRVIDLYTFGGVVATLSVAFTEKRQRLGDLAAGTILIKLKDQITIKQLRPEVEQENYQVVFVEVEQLTDKDIETIKKVLHKWKYEGDYFLVEKCASNLKKALNINNLNGLSDLDFLKTVLKDFSFIANF